MGAEQSRVTGEPAEEVGARRSDHDDRAGDAEAAGVEAATREASVGYRWATEEPDALTRAPTRSEGPLSVPDSSASTVEPITSPQDTTAQPATTTDQPPATTTGQPGATDQPGVADQPATPADEPDATNQPATSTDQAAAADGPVGRTEREATIPPPTTAGSTAPEGDGPPAATATTATTTADAATGATTTAGPESPEGATADKTDPFAAFAPQSPRPPGRIRRVGGAAARALGHEWTLASVGALLLAVVMTWPTLRYPRHTIPQDIWDPTLQAWQMSWSGHILTTDPTRLWHSNAFYPDSFSFAFSDTLLGYAPAGMIGEGVADALLRYNIMYVLAHALAFLGAYALVRQLGAGRTGAAVAGAAFAYAPWRLAQAGHLHVLSTGGIALALAMLARGHGWSLRYGFRPERRNTGWALAGWLVAAWQISLGFGIGLPFAYALAVIVLVAAVAWVVRRTWFWAVKRPFGGRLLVADLVGATIFAVTGALLSLPYFRVAELHPYARRTVEDLRLYSAPVNGFFVAPAESWLWGDLHAAARASLPWHPEQTLLPGFVLYGLALAGLVFSIWTVRQRLLVFAGVVGTVALAMGTRFFGGTLTYLPLYETLPGWDGLRTPGRLVLWTTLLLGILAAGAVCAFIERARESRPVYAPQGLGPWLRVASLIPLVLVLAEGLNRTPHPLVPPAPEALRTAQAPVLVLPSDPFTDNVAMLWTTDGFPALANGNSGFETRRLTELREVTRTFPDVNSVDYLRELGVRTVIVLRVRPDGVKWPTPSDVSAEELGIQREDTPDAVVFRLSG
jgi:hypothetical protein